MERTEKKEIKAPKDSRVLPDHRDPRDLRVTKEIRESPVTASREHKETRETKEKLVHPATQAPPVTMELRDNQETRAIRDNKVM